MRVVLFVLLCCATAASARDRNPARGGAVKCGKAFIREALLDDGMPGRALRVPAGCSEMQIPARYDVRQTQRGTEIWQGTRLLAVVIPPVSTTLPTTTTTVATGTTVPKQTSRNQLARTRKTPGGALIIEVNP